MVRCSSLGGAPGTSDALAGTCTHIGAVCFSTLPMYVSGRSSTCSSWLFFWYVCSMLRPAALAPPLPASGLDAGAGALALACARGRARQRLRRSKAPPRAAQ